MEGICLLNEPEGGEKGREEEKEEDYEVNSKYVLQLR